MPTTNSTLTKREKLAAEIMVCLTPDVAVNEYDGIIEWRASRAVKFADALIEELERTQSDECKKFLHSLLTK